MATEIVKKIKIDNANCQVESAIRDGVGNNIVETYSSIASIQDNLTSVDVNKPLSAKQGTVLRSLIRPQIYDDSNVTGVSHQVNDI